MNQNSDLNFRKLQENGGLISKAEEVSQENEAVKNYPTVGNIRNLTLIAVDGNKQFFNYSYLITCEYTPSDNLITLIYTSHTVILKGLRLAPLYETLSLQLPESIACIEARYNSISEPEQSVVNEIIITKN